LRFEVQPAAEYLQHQPQQHDGVVDYNGHDQEQLVGEPDGAAAQQQYTYNQVNQPWWTAADTSRVYSDPCCCSCVHWRCSPAAASPCNFASYTQCRGQCAMQCAIVMDRTVLQHQLRSCASAVSTYCKHSLITIAPHLHAACRTPASCAV
jgi:hypothetical protein